MGWISIEVKARCPDPARVRRVLKSRHADFKGIDHQIDTYFRVPSGRLKLREGNIENALIYYKRADQAGSKRCDSFLWDLRCGEKGTVPIKKGDCPLFSLKRILKAACGVLTVVAKRREIYFLGNVKFHIDRVQGLGNFVEIEAQDRSGRHAAKVKKQCEFYRRLLGILPEDLLADSYSDQILRRQ